ncbi:MAG: hypothetical protein ACK55I_50265, partial [bacterium]
RGDLERARRDRWCRDDPDVEWFRLTVRRARLDRHADAIRLDRSLERSIRLADKFDLAFVADTRFGPGGAERPHAQIRIVSTEHLHAERIL